MVTLLNNDQLPKLNSNDSFKHAWELANALIRPQFKYRMERCNGFQSVTQASIREMLGINVVKIPKTCGARIKCRTCLFQTNGADAKKKRIHHVKLSITVRNPWTFSESVSKLYNINIFSRTVFVEVWNCQCWRLSTSLRKQFIDFVTDKTHILFG